VGNTTTCINGWFHTSSLRKGPRGNGPN
jgi:hypothetical protein